MKFPKFTSRVKDLRKENTHLVREIEEAVAHNRILHSRVTELIRKNRDLQRQINDLRQDKFSRIEPGSQPGRWDVRH